MKTSPLVEPGCLVFDIGANTGYISDQWTEAGAGKIVAVEPCFKIFDELRKRTNIIPIHSAVWSCGAVIPISYCPTQPGLSTVDPERWGPLFPGHTYEGIEYVPAITMNDLKDVFGMPHLVKVDVEGSEAKVITAMRFKPAVLMFEYHVTYLNESLEILNHLIRLGFTKARHLDGELDIFTVPSTPIVEFIEFWKTGKHSLGNVTAM